MIFYQNFDTFKRVLVTLFTLGDTWYTVLVTLFTTHGLGKQNSQKKWEGAAECAQFLCTFSGCSPFNLPLSLISCCLHLQTTSVWYFEGRSGDTNEGSSGKKDTENLMEVFISHLLFILGIFITLNFWCVNSFKHFTTEN